MFLYSLDFSMDERERNKLFTFRFHKNAKSGQNSKNAEKKKSEQ